MQMKQPDSGRRCCRQPCMVPWKTGWYDKHEVRMEQKNPDKISTRLRAFLGCQRQLGLQCTLLAEQLAIKEECVIVNKNLRMKSRSNQARRDGELQQDEMLTEMTSQSLSVAAVLIRSSIGSSVETVSSLSPLIKLWLGSTNQSLSDS